MLSDLLKNNFLENPALLLVKSVNDIAEIWVRLKQAYGDSKIMLSKKLAEISNIDVLWKVNPGKIVEVLGKVFNLMMDCWSFQTFITLKKSYTTEMQLRKYLNFLEISE